MGMSAPLQRPEPRGSSRASGRSDDALRAKDVLEVSECPSPTLSMQTRGTGGG